MPNVISTSFYTFCIVIPHGSLKLKHTVEKLHQSIRCWWDSVYNIICPGTCNGRRPVEITVKSFISCMMIWTYLHLSNYWTGCSIVLYRVWIAVYMPKMMLCHLMYCRWSTGVCRKRQWSRNQVHCQNWRSDTITEGKVSRKHWAALACSTTGLSELSTNGYATE